MKIGKLRIYLMALKEGGKVLKFKKILNNQRLLLPNFIATKSPHFTSVLL